MVSLYQVLLNVKHDQHLLVLEIVLYRTLESCFHLIQDSEVLSV